MSKPIESKEKIPEEEQRNGVIPDRENERAPPNL